MEGKLSSDDNKDDDVRIMEGQPTRRLDQSAWWDFFYLFFDVKC